MQIMRESMNETAAELENHGHVDARRERVAPLHADQRRAFHVHTGVFAAGMVVIFVVNLAINVVAGIADQWSAWWSAWALIGWSLGLAVHGFVVWINPLVNTASQQQRSRTQFEPAADGGTG